MTDSDTESKNTMQREGIKEQRREIEEETVCEGREQQTDSETHINDRQIQKARIPGEKKGLRRNEGRFRKRKRQIARRRQIKGWSNTQTLRRIYMTERTTESKNTR